MSATIVSEPPLGQRSANPFPGLRPFREDEEHLYFGRERQVDTLIDKLAKTRFLAVVGTSGSGKSSLVNCGLQPALHRGLMTSAGPVWKAAKFRPGRYPIQALAQALASAGVLGTDSEGTPVADIIETYLRVTNRGLVNVFEKSQLPAGTNLLVIADQFEEIFRFRRSVAAQREQYSYSEDVTAFVSLLLAAAESERISVVLTMRSDFLGDCAQFHGLPEAINQGQFLVPRMTRDERRQAIAGPIAVSGGELDPALLSRLVNDVGDNPDQLSILQHCINRMWAHWNALGVDRPISLEDYEAEDVGTMAHALDRHAETVFKEVDARGLGRVCEKTFKALTDKSTDPRGIRRPMEFGELCAIAEATPEQMTQVIDAFREPSRSFLMPPVPEELKPNTMIDISHESLMRVWERLRAWVEDEAQSAAMYRRLAESARLHAAGKAGEWRNPELQLAVSWQEWERPTAAWAEMYGGNFNSTMAFLEKSRQSQLGELAEAKFEQNWRSRWTPIGLAVALIVALLYFEKFERWIQGHILHVVSDSSSPVRYVARLLATSFTAAIFLGCYLLYDRYAKAFLHRLTIRKIGESIAQPSASTVKAGAMGSGPRPELPLLSSEYAAFGRRFLSALIDGVVCLALFFLLVIVMVLFHFDIDKNQNVVWFYAILFAGRVVYHGISLSSKWQASLGMKAVGIYVTDMNGNRLSWARAVMREFAKLLTLYSFWIGAFMPLWTKQRQTLHDKIVGSVVLRKAAITKTASATPQGAVPAVSS